jgi:hypothetical protein
MQFDLHWPYFTACGARTQRLRFRPTDLLINQEVLADQLQFLGDVPNSSHQPRGIYNVRSRHILPPNGSSGDGLNNS